MWGLRVLGGGLTMLAAAGLAPAEDAVSPTPEPSPSATPEVSCGGKFTCVPIEQPVEVVANRSSSRSRWSPTSG
jgi:hypothetical protein